MPGETAYIDLRAFGCSRAAGPISRKEILDRPMDMSYPEVFQRLGCPAMVCGEVPVFVYRAREGGVYVLDFDHRGDSTKEGLRHVLHEIGRGRIYYVLPRHLTGKQAKHSDFL